MNCFEKLLEEFEVQLVMEEKSPATVEQYLRYSRKFLVWKGNRKITKQLVLEYKDVLLDKYEKISTINSMLIVLNIFLKFIGKDDCVVNTLKAQRDVYCPDKKMLTRNDYHKLLKAAEKMHMQMLRLIMMTLASTGIRISELKFFTVEGMKDGEVVVYAKGKNRKLLIPGKLKKALLDFAKKNGFRSGHIFRNDDGEPVGRIAVWREMKSLSTVAGVEPEKVFPHNFRKLFARTYYHITGHDIAALADILGHSNINTTRIYIKNTAKEFEKQLDGMGLIE